MRAEGASNCILPFVQDCYWYPGALLRDPAIATLNYEKRDRARLGLVGLYTYLHIELISFIFY
jgi:hypothetical protein